MDLLANTKKICRERGIHPARSKGQNFLINEEVYDKIIKAAELKPYDIVLEVGPGLGFLTAKLAQRVKKVIAVELDDRLTGFLRKSLAEQKIGNVLVINEDILKISNFQFPMSSEFSDVKYLMSKNGQAEKDELGIAKRKLRKYKIVANLPYNITSIFLRKFLSQEIHRPELMVLMLQKEVAERIAAKPTEMSLLSVSVQFYAEPEIMEIVSKSNFWPAPAVDSAIIKLKVKNEKLKILDVDKGREFFKIVKFGFSARRKMLKNNLAAGLRIDDKITESYLKLAKLSPKARAQDLTVADWLKLFDIISQNMV